MIGGGELELDDGFVVVDADVVLLDGKLNRGVELLCVELDVADSLDEDKEEDVTADLLGLKVDNVLDRVLVVVKDLAVPGAHAFVLGVYNGPSGGYSLVDAVSAVVVFVLELLVDVLKELLLDVIEVLLELVFLLELVLDSLLEDFDVDILDILLVETLESLLDDPFVELAAALLGTWSFSPVEVGNSDIVLVELLLED